MASIDATALSIVHATLTADTVDDVTFSRAREIEVVNVDGADAIYFTTDGTDPTVAGDDTHVVPGTIGYLEVFSKTPVVKLISSGTPKYSVRVVR